MTLKAKLFSFPMTIYITGCKLDRYNDLHLQRSKIAHPGHFVIAMFYCSLYILKHIITFSALNELYSTHFYLFLFSYMWTIYINHWEKSISLKVKDRRKNIAHTCTINGKSWFYNWLFPMGWKNLISYIWSYSFD